VRWRSALGFRKAWRSSNNSAEAAAGAVKVKIHSPIAMGINASNLTSPFSAAIVETTARAAVNASAQNGNIAKSSVASIERPAGSRTRVHVSLKTRKMASNMVIHPRNIGLATTYRAFQPGYRSDLPRRWCPRKVRPAVRPLPMNSKPAAKRLQAEGGAGVSSYRFQPVPVFSSE
jgi:hypothetical protein